MKTFAELYESMKDTHEYQVEELAFSFTESVLLRMEDLGDMTRADLAGRMKVSEAYVSKILKGTSNFTFDSLVKLARALDCRVAAPTLIPNERHASAQLVSFSRRPKPLPFRPQSLAVGAGLGTSHDNSNADNSAAAA
jgi:transcriptional regulator with XRE-family HTH domain